jgi:hypothetical protein
VPLALEGWPHHGHPSSYFPGHGASEVQSLCRGATLVVVKIHLPPTGYGMLLPIVPLSVSGPGGGYVILSLPR